MTDTEAPSHREAQADAKAAKARSKALRPWFKKKRFIIPIVVVVIGVIATAANGADDDTPSASSASPAEESAGGESDDASTDGASSNDEADPTDTRNNDLYPERPDKQADDHEAELGQAVRLSGYTVAVTGVERYADPVWGDHVVVHVSVENRDDKAQPYNTFDWRIQTENGQVLDPTISSRDDDLGSGDLVKGGTVTGTVSFEVGAGTYYVIYKPDLFNAARGIWKATT